MRYLVNTTYPMLLPLERQRDHLVQRIIQITHEPNPLVVEGFEYLDPLKARKVRGRLACGLLRRIDRVNREICRIIAPGFSPRASEGFSDRVMAATRTMEVPDHAA